MSVLAIETNGFTANPLDVVEEIVHANDWAFDRTSNDEMVVEVAGRWCSYRLFFFWQDEISAMQFSSTFDMKVPAQRRASVMELLALVNEQMWLGHFDLDSDDSTLMFRHTTLLRGAQAASVEQLEDLVEIALTECERFYPAFQFCVWGGKSAGESVSAAILDTVAEA